jgi:hypothetical protein
MRGRRAADARRHAIGLLDIGAPPEAPRSSSTSSRRPVSPRDDLVGLPNYMGYCPHRREGHMRCGTRDGRTLSRRRRLDPRLLLVRSRRAATEPWAARNGVKAARGALLSAPRGTQPDSDEMLVLRGMQEPRARAECRILMQAATKSP